MTRALVAIVAAVSFIAADPVNTGTDPGQVLSGPFSTFIVWPKAVKKAAATMTEERENFGDATRFTKFHDPVTRFGLDPTVAVFTREAPSGESLVGKLIVDLDKTATKYPNSRLHSFAVYMLLKDEHLKDDDRLKQKKAIIEFAEQQKLGPTPLALEQADTEKTRNWRITAEDQTVVIVYDNLRVKAKFVFTKDQPLDEDAFKKITAEVQKFVKK